MKAQVKGIISCNFRTWKLILGTASFCLEFSLRLHLRVQPLGLEIQELKCCLHCIIMALGIFKITISIGPICVKRKYTNSCQVKLLK